MTEEQKRHLSQIQSKVADLINLKYRRGCEEHHGDLMDLTSRQLIEEAIYEAIDQLTYLLTVQERM